MDLTVFIITWKRSGLYLKYDRSMKFVLMCKGVTPFFGRQIWF